MKQTNGFIMIPRQLMVSEVWKKATKDQKLAIIDLYFRVAYKEHECECKYGKFELKKGQIVTSLSTLSEYWNCHVSKVRRTLAHLKKHGFATTSNAVFHPTQKTTQKTTQITLLTINDLQDRATQTPTQKPTIDIKRNNNNNLSNDKFTQIRARESRFVKPSPGEVQQYLDEKGITSFNANDFCSYYESCGWVVGRNKPMKSWKGAVETWIRFEKNNTNHHATPHPQYIDYRARRDAEHERIRQSIIRSLMEPDNYDDPEYQLPF